MKIILNIALWTSYAAAYPGMMDRLTAPLLAEARLELAKRQNAAAPQGVGALPPVPPPFNAQTQYVSNQGAHAFVPPGPGDARGMCPGLNAMANHNYLPHNGVATIQQFTDATQLVFGMGADLAAFLAVYGAIVDGSGTQWSINGGIRTGIGGSHSNYEADSSPLKSDLNQYGSNERLIMSQFYNLYNRQPDASTANYNLEVLRDFRASRFQESIDKNPYFFYPPFGGNLVTQAAFTFIYRFMANHTAQYPEGVLNKNVLKSFMSITGPENNLKWTPGYERIPDNWYKRNEADAYTQPYFLSDVLYFAEKYPQILGIGCNEGKVDTFNTFDPAVLTNGAYTSQQAAASPLCFSYEYVSAELASFTGLSASKLAPLTSQLQSLTSSMNCAPITSLNNSGFAVCPGASLYGGPTARVAPGAIQS